jgi:hypothetical protein
MAERGGKPGFPFETAAAHRVGRDVLAQEFQGDVTTEALVEGEIHLAHATSTEQSHDFVRAESLADAERHERERSG